MGQAFQLEKIFPPGVREALSQRPWQEGLEEIRVRIGQPVEFSYDTGNRYLARRGGRRLFLSVEEARRDEDGIYCTGLTEIAEMLNYISNYSLYAYKEEMKQGFITIEGGHRVGLAGSVVMENGKITGLFHITFLNIRVAHERRGCAKKLVSFIRCGNSIFNTLFLSEPGAGKTTFLRDCIRELSSGDDLQPGIKVCVVDERSEIAACHAGIPQNDLGPRTDVLDGCSKAEGMQMLLRSMSPQVLAVDELGTERDFQAVEQAVYSGSRVLGTIHAGDIRELTEKPYLDRWIKKQVFGRYVLIRRRENGERDLMVYDSHMERLC